MNYSADRARLLAHLTGIDSIHADDPLDLSGPGRTVQDLRHFKVDAGFRGRSLFSVQLWWFVQATFFRHSPQILYGFRRWLLRMFGARIGRGVILRPSATITYPWKVSIGDHSWIGDDVVLYSLGPITIGRDAVVSQRSYLCAGSHDHRTPAFSMIGLPIIIGDETWLAADVFVAPGLTIGRGAVVGARSSVFTDLPEMMMCHGTPAVPVSARNPGA